MDSGNVGEGERERVVFLYEHHYYILERVIRNPKLSFTWYIEFMDTLLPVIKSGLQRKKRLRRRDCKESHYIKIDSSNTSRWWLYTECTQVWGGSIRCLRTCKIRGSTFLALLFIFSPLSMVHFLIAETQMLSHKRKKRRNSSKHNRIKMPIQLFSITLYVQEHKSSLNRKLPMPQRQYHKYLGQRNLARRLYSLLN